MPPPFIPDVPYKIQAIFILTASYIWATAFQDDYLAPMPEKWEDRVVILVRYLVFNECVYSEVIHKEDS